VGPTVSDYGREGDEARRRNGLSRLLGQLRGPADRNVIARIKGGSRVTAGLIENRGHIGIKKEI
jgi:hypothetical protein